jgi:hypothetical protein
MFKKLRKKIKGFHHWKQVKGGKKTYDLKLGAGYYIITGLLGYNPIGQKKELEMKSGKIGIYELIDYKTFWDPKDMIEKSYWHFIGYKNVKPIKECSFNEFLQLYWEEKIQQ